MHFPAHCNLFTPDTSEKLVNFTKAQNPYGPDIRNTEMRLIKTRYGPDIRNTEMRLLKTRDALLAWEQSRLGPVRLLSAYFAMILPFPQPSLSSNIVQNLEIPDSI
jgi:hypothetical protein